MAKTVLFAEDRQRLAEEAAGGSLVLFVGAGASADAGLPVWKKLIATMRDELNVSDEGDDLDVAQWYANALGRDALTTNVRRQLSGVGQQTGARRRSAPPILDGQPGALHRALARVPAPVLFTTNFDVLLEQAIEQQQQVPPDVIIDDPDIGLIDEGRRTTVVKLHGCLSLPQTIVLARDDYETYEDRHPAMVTYLQSLLATRTFLFVGYSLTDQDFRSIHHAIGRALAGRQRHHAYVLDVSGRSKYVADYWLSKGIRTLAFPANDFAAVREFVADVAVKATKPRSAIDMARLLGRDRPPPAIHVEPFVDRLLAMSSALDDVIQIAQDEGVMPTYGSPPAEQLDGGPGVRDKARALLELAEAVNHLMPIENPDRWVALGDMLYAQSDFTAAIRAYNNALSPMPDRHQLDESIELRVRGNLGRSYAYGGHYRRGEWLLRKCVFKPGLEVSDGLVERDSVYARMRFAHLGSRPTDGYELVFSVTRRIEALRQGSHLNEAFDAQSEIRYVLELLLGIKEKHPDPLAARNYFEHYDGMMRKEKGRQKPFVSQAWALSFLGKAYRLGCQIGLDLGRDDALAYYLPRAEKHLRNATALDSLLPYPYGHRGHLANDHRVPKRTRQQLTEELQRDVARIPANPEGRRMRERLRKEFPALAL